MIDDEDAREEVQEVVDSLRSLADMNRDMENENARVAADAYADAASYAERVLLDDEGYEPAAFVGYCLECGAKHEVSSEFDPEERGCMCGGNIVPSPTDGEGVPV